MPRDIWKALPLMFTYSEARRRGLSDRRLYALRDQGVIETSGRGLYRRADAAAIADLDLLEIAHRAARDAPGDGAPLPAR